MDYKEKVIALLNSQELSQEQKEKLEEIFPELKESEDEKIRKMLIEQMERWHECALENNVVQDIKDSADAIAWLEKQGQTFTKKDVDDAYLKGVCDTKHELEKQGEQNTNHKTMIVNFLCKKDWHGIGDYCCGKIYNGYPCEKEQKGYDIYDDNHIPTFCGEDFINEYFNIVTEEKQDEQKPAWSEGDESIALGIEQLCNCADLLMIAPDKIDKIRNWLKSLRPQNTWKPSDEQMKALDDVISSKDIKYDVLSELYKDLKKLREE